VMAPWIIDVNDVGMSASDIFHDNGLRSDATQDE
jgi:hypothetical protein